MAFQTIPKFKQNMLGQKKKKKKLEYLNSSFLPLENIINIIACKLLTEMCSSKQKEEMFKQF